MKKFIFLLLAVSLFYTSHAQNNYPPTGNVGWGVSPAQYRLDIRDTSSAVYSPGTVGAPVPAGPAVHISNTKTVNSKGAFLHLVSANSGGVNQAAYMGVISNAGAVYTPEFVIGQRTNVDTYTERLRIAATGNIGIGIIPGTAKLEVAGLVQTSGIQGGYKFNSRQGTGHDYQWYSSNNNAHLYDHNDAANRITVAPGGNVGIGTDNPGTYKLAVEGILGARKVKVTQASWADFVFHPDYQLPSLQELEIFVKQHRHLPDIPNEDEIKKEGLDLGEMNKKLLQKVEELTLHLINQQKINDQQTARIDQLEKKLAVAREK